LVCVRTANLSITPYGVFIHPTSILAAPVPKLKRFHRWGAVPQSHPMFSNPWNLLMIALAGWLNREQAAVVDYLEEENRILR
jgi:hypothetical protein